MFHFALIKDGERVIESFKTDEVQKIITCLSNHLKVTNVKIMIVKTYTKECKK